MYTKTLITTIVLTVSLGAVGSAQHEEHHARKGIPRSVQQEHEELHATLSKAMLRPDSAGSAARELWRVLTPHFQREQDIALAPLGALPALVQGGPVDNAEVLSAMTDSLEREMPRMLREHKAIAVAVERLRVAAVSAKADDLVRFAHDLRLHALAEEEIHYPAALLVGRLLSQISNR